MEHKAPVRIARSALMMVTRPLAALPYTTIFITSRKFSRMLAECGISIATLWRTAQIVAALSAGADVRAVAAQVYGPAEVRPLVQAAVQKAGASMGVLVDPRLVEEMTGSIVIFTGNFCGPENSPTWKTKCFGTVGTPSVMSRVAAEYLKDVIVGQPAKVVAFGARLAREVGNDLAQAGWPSDVINQAAVVEIGETWRNADFSIQTASGPVPLGTGGRIILLSPGSVTILARLPGNATQSIALQLQARTTTRLSPTSNGPVAAAGPGRVEPKPDSFCYSAAPINFFWRDRSLQLGPRSARGVRQSKDR